MAATPPVSQGRTLRRRPQGADNANATSLVGRLYRIQRKGDRFEGCLTKIINDNRTSLLLTHEGTKTVKVPVDDFRLNKTYPLPPWISLARSWDDLDRFLREFNEQNYMDEPSKVEKVRD